MENKTKLLLATCMLGAIATTMFIGNLFFNADFGLILPFTFLFFQAVFLILTIRTDD